MVDAGLIVSLTAWYVGNYYYNIYNKVAAQASGGTEFAFTLAWLQLAVGSVYALFLWIAPEARTPPKMSFSDVLKLAPLGLYSAVAHVSAVYAMSAGAVSFGQVIKAAEPVFAAIIGYTVYGKTVSTAKIFMLIPIVGGICIASVSELDFAWAALIAASTANVASAFRGQENKRVGELPGLKEAMGGTGNKFAMSQLWATIFLLPTVFISGEYAKIDNFTTMWAADGIPGKKGLVYSTIMSGLTFYLYNEVSTLALNKISGVTHSVANTAKRAIIIVGCAIAFGESMSMPKMVGCGIAIGGTFFYAIIDDLVKPKKA